MPTWGQHYADAERTVRRQAADTALRARHDQFDRQAQDKTAKFERHHFAVVGEGSHASQEAYRQNYERIFPACRPDASSRPASLPPRPRVGAAICAQQYHFHDKAMEPAVCPECGHPPGQHAGLI